MDYSRLCINCMHEKAGDSHICSHCGFDDRTYVYPPYVLQPFTPLNGKYIIGKMLGSGGFGITYIAMDTALDRVVAIKEFFVQQSMYRHTTVSSDVTVSNLSHSQEKVYEVNRIKFEQEAKTLARLTNMPGIVRVYDFFRENNTSYMVLEYLSGMTLKDYVKKQGGKLSFDEVIQKLTPVMTSLDLLHKTTLASDVSQGKVAEQQTGIIHRDISPDNIMVSDEGKLTLFDFGGAKIQHEVKSYVVMAKAGYSPIEQLQSTDEIGPWVDVYAMAATIYYCLCGHIPVESTRRAAEEKDPLVRPSKEGVVITSKQEQVLLKGLALNYKDRYRSMAEFRNALLGEKAEGEGGGQGGSRLPLIVIPLAVLAFAVGGILAVRNLNRQSSAGEEAGVETETGAETASIVETEPETELQTEEETRAETETETEEETEAETETETEEETQRETETETEEETQRVTETETENAREEETESRENDVLSADTIIQEYNLGLLTYNEAAAQMESSDSPENGKERLDELKASKDAYRRGILYAQSSSTAEEALEQFQSVVPEDVNYEDAQEQIQEISSAREESEKLADTETEAETETAAGALDAGTEEGIHRYDFYYTDGSWSDSFQSCLEKGGYLVHINSQEEMDFLIEGLESYNLRGTRFYVGARREQSDVLYYWMDENNRGYGEAINYESWWMDGEPSLYDSRGDQQYAEDVVELFYSEDEGRWVLNDIPDDLPAYLPGVDYSLGFICEFAK